MGSIVSIATRCVPAVSRAHNNRTRTDQCLNCSYPNSNFRRGIWKFARSCGCSWKLASTPRLRPPRRSGRACSLFGKRGCSVDHRCSNGNRWRLHRAVNLSTACTWEELHYLSKHEGFTGVNKKEPTEYPGGKISAKLTMNLCSSWILKRSNLSADSTNL